MKPRKEYTAIILITLCAFIFRLAYHLQLRFLIGDPYRYVAWGQEFTATGVLPEGQMPIAFLFIRLGTLFTNDVVLVLDVLTATFITIIGALLFFIILGLTGSFLGGLTGFIITLIPTTKTVLPGVMNQPYFREVFLVGGQYIGLSLLADCTVLKNLIGVTFLLVFILCFHTVLRKPYRSKGLYVGMVAVTVLTCFTHLLASLVLVGYTVLTLMIYLPFNRKWNLEYPTNPFMRNITILTTIGAGIFLTVYLLTPMFSLNLLHIITYLTTQTIPLEFSFLTPRLIILPAAALILWFAYRRTEKRSLYIITSLAVLMGFLLFPLPDVYQFRSTIMAYIPYTILVGCIPALGKVYGGKAAPALAVILVANHLTVGFIF